MLNQAVAHYHELLNDHELASESLAMLDKGLERAKLIFGGRRLSPYLRPHFVDEDDFTQVVSVCETVWSAIEKVKDAAVSDESLLIELGLTEVGLTEVDPTEVGLTEIGLAEVGCLYRCQRHPCLAQLLDRAKSSIVVTRAAASEYFCCP